MHIVRAEYGGYAGLMHRGTTPYRATPSSEPLHKLVSVTCVTEGGTFEAANTYDRCVISLGLIQLCGAIGNLFPLMRSILEQLPAEALKPLRDWERKYQVHFLASLAPSSQNVMAMRLFGCGGRVGDWTEESYQRVEELLEAICPILGHPLARRIQLDLVASTILNYVMPDTHRILFQDLPSDGWIGALQAAVVSFSANLPAVADRHFRAYVSENGPIRAERDYVAGAIEAMTNRPKIAIYPHRRTAILPEIERLYGVRFKTTPPPPPTSFSTQELQSRLLRLGYDPGPVDGIAGRKTREAVMAFQRKVGLTADGIVGPKTFSALVKAGGETPE